MINYRQQNGCHNCKHVFVKSEYDEGSDYFCTLNAGVRPKCGSVLMDEAFFLGMTEEQFEKRAEIGEKLMTEWYAWSDKNGVSREGICDAHSPTT